MDENKSLIKYSGEYSESKLFKKIAAFAKVAGAKIVYAAFLSYYVLLDESVPKTKKALILGALGYFILPVDLIPDAIPVLGLTEDLSALLYALMTVWEYVTPEIQEMAREKVKGIFGEIKEDDLKLF